MDVMLRLQSIWRVEVPTGRGFREQIEGDFIHPDRHCCEIII
jgi:hypothetical protein